MVTILSHRSIVNKQGEIIEEPELFPVIRNNTDASTVYTTPADWTFFTSGNLYSNDGKYSNVTGATITQSFRRKIQWWTEKFNHHGIAKIYINDVFIKDIDLYASPNEPTQLMFESATYQDAANELKIVVSGEKNTASGGYYIVHDRFVTFQDDEPVTYAGMYYVDGTSGLDTNVGSSPSPFKSIDKAASLASPGDIVVIRSGTYRSTVRPFVSGTSEEPIIFMAELGADVTISGLNLVGDTGWTVHSGQIYKKNITLPVGGFRNYITSGNSEPDLNTYATADTTALLANQIFKGGEMMFQSGWPKRTNMTSIMTYDSLRNLVPQNNSGNADLAKFQPGYLIDTTIPTAYGNLTGATMVAIGWFWAMSRTIASHNTGTQQLNFNQNLHGTDDNGRMGRRAYWLTNHLNLLTDEKEWHYDPAGVLYFRQPGGGSPTGVEYKARNWGFDLRDRSHIHVYGIKFIGCDPGMGNNSTNFCIYDNIRATYMNHSVRHDNFVFQGYGNARQTGLRLCGNGNIVRNSKFQYCAAQAIWLGPNSKAENNLIEDVGYDGGWGAAIGLWGRLTDGQKVLRNTVRRCGRSCFDWGWDWYTGPYVNNPRGHKNVEVGYNDFSGWGKINFDVGALYGWAQNDLSGSRVHHNWIHDIGTAGSLDAPVKDGIFVGGYNDMASGGITFDHNVFWNCGISDIYHEIASGDYPDGRLNYYYNNTFASTFRYSYVTYHTAHKDVFRNCIFRAGIVTNWTSPHQADLQNCLQSSTNPLFVGTGDGGLQFRLQAGSPAINAGQVISGITTGSVGTPDIGAYEYGGEEWEAGFEEVVYTGT